MLKRGALRRIVVSSFALLLLFIICLIPSNNNNAKPSVIFESSIIQPVYLQDHNNYIARVNVTSKESTIPYIIELLTINGKYSSNIPNGFKAIIPEKTELIKYKLDNNILYLNFSYHLLNITEENEEDLIEGLIYTLCELDNVDGISISVNGLPLNELPNSHKSLPQILTIEYGINKNYILSNLKNSSQITVYYSSNYHNTDYYIPITKITNEDASKIEVIVNELKSTPYINSNISNYLKASYELESYEVLENSIKLTFNNDLIAGLQDKDIEEELKYVLTLSIRDTYNIHNVIIDIN